MFAGSAVRIWHRNENVRKRRYAELSKLGGQFNPFIDELLQKPLNFSGPEQESQLHILMGGRAMVSKTNDNLNGFYHYIGPLATKPFSYSVRWYIARKVFEISEVQLEKIKQYKAQ